MRWREFITGLGVAAAWLLVAHGQQATTIGLLIASLTSPSHANGMVAVRQGLKEMGYVEGQNLRIEYRAPEGQYDRLSALAADLVRSRVQVILADAVPAERAAQAATAAIPIVFLVGGDPVREGLVPRLSRPEAHDS
jgi:putative tryptophan/tyrosine transport system substrate-binding protein